MLLLQIITFCLVSQVSRIHGEYFSSVSGLTDLLELEANLIHSFEKYLERVEETNKEVNRFLKRIEEKVEEVNADPSYYDNPINAYQIISRLAIDWKYLEGLVFNSKVKEEYAKNISEYNAKEQLELPSILDLQGAAKAFVRLQVTYDLDTDEVADGQLLEHVVSGPMSSSDCFYLGKQLYEVQEYKYAAEWLMQARVLLQQEMAAADNNTLEFPHCEDIQILEFLAPSFYYLNNSKMASKFNDEMLSKNAHHENALKNKALYQNKAIEERRTMFLEEPAPVVAASILMEAKLTNIYQRTCRGELRQTPREKRNLRCRYICRQEVPFCRIAPFKMEELNLDPPVAYYHQTIYDNEIEKIFNFTVDFLERSRVGDTNTSIYSEIRTSQQTWLYYEEHSFLKDLKQRLIDITGLNIETAEPLQVANYGIGGHYGPHYDFTEINEVELGGATAFPYLHLLAPPIKGSMVVWYNLHDSLALDYRTKHAGCPVLVGSKWICNEWFHEKHQEFHRPCVKNDEHLSVNYQDAIFLKQ